ncbi:uncharacterized protein YegP (UPF0339 family) [Cellulophaga sp. RHA19]|uniref:YegP family protein n=1 Tax=Cellulophaga sp. RHA19 TaxID=1798237 RepID=UPI000C2C2A42|nr:YegP family protein [Cellulophaga sp. RHA19]PKB42708.1 uncharacterized protein YegP (UPF0339 family) [Cellulophaga sp. RHA19]
MSKPFYEIKKTNTNEYCFNLKNSEGEIVLYGETFKNIAKCKQQIIFVKQHAYDYDYYHSKVTQNNEYYFYLCLNEDTLLGKSKKYKTIEAKEMAIATVMLCATIATIKHFK